VAENGTTQPVDIEEECRSSTMDMTMAEKLKAI